MFASFIILYVQFKLKYYHRFVIEDCILALNLFQRLLRIRLSE